MFQYHKSYNIAAALQSLPTGQCIRSSVLDGSPLTHALMLCIMCSVSIRSGRLACEDSGAETRATTGLPPSIGASWALCNDLSCKAEFNSVTASYPEIGLVRSMGDGTMTPTLLRLRMPQSKRNEIETSIMAGLGAGSFTNRLISRARPTVRRLK